MGKKLKPVGDFVLSEDSYNCSHFFEGKIVYLDKLSGFDTGSITDMSYMFKDSFITFSEDFDENEVFSLSSVIKAENVTKASHMFDGAEFDSHVIIDLDFSNLEEADSIFAMMLMNKSIAVNISVPNMRNFTNAFFGVYFKGGCCLSIRDLGPSACISGMFRKANITKNLFDCIDTIKVLNAESMFNQAYFDEGAELPESVIFNENCVISNIFKEAYFLEGFTLRRDMFRGKLLSSYFKNALYGNKNVVSKKGLFDVDFIV